MFSIYFSIYLVQKSVRCFLSMSYAYFTVLRTYIPILCDVRQYLDFTLEIILSQQRKVSLNHKTKEGSSLISFATSYSASPNGLDCLSSFIGTQSTDTSFQSTKLFQPGVVLFPCSFPLLDLIKPNILVIALPSIL